MSPIALDLIILTSELHVQEQRIPLAFQ